MSDRAIEIFARQRYRVRRGFRGVAILQRLIDSPAFLGGQVDASHRHIHWVDVDYDNAPTELASAMAQEVKP